MVIKVGISEISKKQPFAKVYTRKFYEIGRLRKFVPVKFSKSSKRVIRESLYQRKFVPAKVSTIKVVLFLRVLLL